MLAIIARFCGGSEEISQEFCNLISLPENSTVAVIYKGVVND
jgi:hypothetical protein